MESRIFGQEDGFSGEFDEFFLPVGAAGVENLGNVPVMVGSRCDEIAVHGPVVGPEKVEGVFRRVLVVVFPDQQEAGGKAVAERLGPWDVPGSGESLVDEVEYGEQQRFVRSLVRTSFLYRRGADVEVVEPFNRLVQSHGRRKAEGLLEGKPDLPGHGKTQASWGRRGWPQMQIKTRW